MSGLLVCPDLPDEVDGAAAWVAEHLDGLFGGEARRSGAFVGGQTSADEALDALDITGYARRRSQVWPEPDRGASKLSPYVRHGLLSLPRVHDDPRVADAPSYDRFKYRGELLWQEYSRHWYAVHGTATREGVANDPQPSPNAVEWEFEPWPDEMECMARTTGELHADGWVVNQARMWLASQWSVRAGSRWQDGEDEMFRHLLDGSRAANRQGWQWTVGGSRARAYSFARRQVLKRAPEFCDACSLRDDCPISGYPGTEAGPKTGASRRGDDSFWFGPQSADDRVPEAVWLTAESLGDDDPALAAHPDLPVHFVYDEPLLRSLQLDGKRLVFLTECLANLAQRRAVTVWRGRPDLLAGEVGQVAVTFAGVPGFGRVVAAMANSGTEPVIHPFPWLRPPTDAYVDHLQSTKAFPSFKAFCSLTKPTRAE